jgi:hypothetical protein
MPFDIAAQCADKAATAPARRAQHPSTPHNNSPAYAGRANEPSAKHPWCLSQATAWAALSRQLQRAITPPAATWRKRCKIGRPSYLVAVEAKVAPLAAPKSGHNTNARHAAWLTAAAAEFDPARIQRVPVGARGSPSKAGKAVKLTPAVEYLAARLLPDGSLPGKDATGEKLRTSLPFLGLDKSVAKHPSLPGVEFDIGDGTIRGPVGRPRHDAPRNADGTLRESKLERFRREHSESLPFMLKRGERPDWREQHVGTLLGWLEDRQLITTVQRAAGIALARDEYTLTEGTSDAHTASVPHAAETEGTPIEEIAGPAVERILIDPAERDAARRRWDAARMAICRLAPPFQGEGQWTELLMAITSDEPERYPFGPQMAITETNVRVLRRYLNAAALAYRPGGAVPDAEPGESVLPRKPKGQWGGRRVKGQFVSKPKRMPSLAN